jgi:hypothetical protein
MILAAMYGDDAFVLNTKRGKGMQSTYRREKIVRTEKELCAMLKWAKEKGLTIEELSI